MLEGFHQMAGNQNWETPWKLFNRLNDAFHFTLDGAASIDNSKCDNFITEKQNAHITYPEGEVIFCNPPYSNVLPWAKTFNRWAESNIVVALVQDRTDTQWWGELTKSCSQVVFLTPRVNFIGTVTGNNRGSAVVVLGLGNSRVVELQWNWLCSPFPMLRG